MRGDERNGMLAGVGQTQHVGPGRVAVDQVDGEDEDHERDQQSGVVESAERPGIPRSQAMT